VNPALPNKPSLVVLPFANLSDDPAQEYFSDGMTEELTTDLSQNPSLFVISRNSAFTYKGKSVKVEDVGRELGVRYVLEGSVRKAGDRVRIAAQLVDATTGFHVWSEHYDRELADVFAVQSEISREILEAVGIRIRDAEIERARRQPTGDLNAYDALMRGMYHFTRFTRADSEEARRWLERAIELDPRFADPVSLLGTSYAVEYTFGWNRDPALLDRAEALAREALELDATGPGGYYALANLYIARGEWDRAAEASQKSIDLAPNVESGYVFLALAESQRGRALTATRAIQQALRLNPRLSPQQGSGLLTAIAYANLAVGRREEAMKLLEEIRTANRDNLIVRAVLAREYERAGRHAEASATVREILGVNPALTADEAAFFGGGEPTPEAQAEAVALLRKAGLP
jgi:adenylate cyclase